MRIAFFSAKPYERAFFTAANAAHDHDLQYLEPKLTGATAVLANGAEAVCAFVNDQLDAEVLRTLAEGGTRIVALRSAGFNHVDLGAASELGLTVVRVPAYSPHAVAEHALALVLSLNRKVHRAYARVREGNFALDGLLGFDLCGKTVGVIGTGNIGRIFARIMRGLACNVIATDPYTDEELAKEGVIYVELDELLRTSDVISLHCPLVPGTHHLLDANAFARMKPGVMVINTSRGALVDASAAIGALKAGHIGALGLDVYEEEEDLFFEDLSLQVLQDDVFARLLTFPNVLITGHQGFFTREALTAIAETTLANITGFETGDGEVHVVPGSTSTA